MRTVAHTLSCSVTKKAWLLTVLLSTAELSETLVGVFLPGPQARLVAGSVLLLTPRSFAGTPAVSGGGGMQGPGGGQGRRPGVEYGPPVSGAAHIRDINQRRVLEHIRASAASEASIFQVC